MKKFILISLYILSIMSFSSCDKENDVADVEISSYLIGRWHSSYIEAFRERHTAWAETSKTGEYAAVYYEIVFKKDGTYSWGYWQKDSYGISRWTEEYGKYYLKGNIISLVDPNNIIVDFLFDSEQRTLCLHVQTIVNGINAVINIYLKKY